MFCNVRHSLEERHDFGAGSDAAESHGDDKISCGGGDGGLAVVMVVVS